MSKPRLGGKFYIGLAWGTLISIVLWAGILYVVALFAGCAKIEYRGIKYERWGSQQLNDVLIEIQEPNGVSIGLIIEGQKSDFELGFEAGGMKVGVK